MPQGWCVAAVGDVATPSGGGTPPKGDPLFWDDGTIPWVSPKDMKRFLIRSAEDRVTEKALERLTLIPSDSVLVVVRSGILSRTLPVAINKLSVTVNQDMRAFVPSAGIDARYLAWQLVSCERDILDRCAKDGTTVASIEGPALAGYRLAIAPANEQLRIADKLEELLSELDAGVAELKAAQRKLVKHRQSLLKAAVEGTLTADWRAAREARGGPQESGAELLQRILTERRARWEQKQLASFAEKQKAPTVNWKARYPEPVRPNAAEHSLHLPAEWAWATVDQLSVAQRYGTSAKTHEAEDGVPVLRMGNIQAGEIDLAKLKCLPITHDEFPDLFLEDGEILFNRTNSPELVGKTAVYRSQVVPCSYASYLISVKVAESCSPEFVSTFINSLHGRNDEPASVLLERIRTERASKPTTGRKSGRKALESA